jgi:hypothetical protein
MAIILLDRMKHVNGQSEIENTRGSQRKDEDEFTRKDAVKTCKGR